MVELCEVCKEIHFKYKCPKCFKKTCSLPCSQKHKANDGCSGKAHDPTLYIAHENLKKADDEKHERNLLVQRDYQFLNKLKRSLEVDMRDGRLNNKRILQPYGNHHAKRPHHDQECQRVIRRGVNCILLPKGMQRSLMNKSKWDKPLDIFVWSIEWILCPRKQEAGLQEPFKHVSHRVKETDTLAEGMGKVIYERCYEFYRLAAEGEPLPETKLERTERLINSGLKFYTKWFPYNSARVMDSKKLVELDACQKPIAELFRNRTVIEFPTIFVATDRKELPEEFTLIDEKAKHPKQRDTNNGSDDDDNGDSSNDSDTGSEPQEESSKPDVDPNTAESDDDSDGYDPGVTLDFLAG